MMVFDNRMDAGRHLAEEICNRAGDVGDDLVLGIPRGGIAVGYPVAERLACPLEPVTLRKLPLPLNDQVGFGAVTLDRTVVYNDRMLDSECLAEEDVERVVGETYAEVLRRDRMYRGDRPFPVLSSRKVVIVDDGLATGYTMLAAVAFVRERGVSRVAAAVPVAHRDAFELIAPRVDDLICLEVRRELPFAVASSYRRFPDMTDREVTGLLDSARRGFPTFTR